MFAFAILALQTKGGFRHLEAIIIGLVGLIVAGFAFEVVNAGASLDGVAKGLVIPRFSGIRERCSWRPGSSAPP